MAILLIAACAVTCDANGFTVMWQWAADAGEEVLARLGVRADPLTGACTPQSERTIRRPLARVDAAAVERAAGRFVAGRLRSVGLGGSQRVAAGEREQRRVRRAERDRTRPPRRSRRRGVAFDGKVLRGACRRGGKRVNLLGAAEHATGTVLAQHEIDAKTNEIPELRAMLTNVDLTGCMLTADALHCQADTAQAAVDARGHVCYRPSTRLSPCGSLAHAHRRELEQEHDTTGRSSEVRRSWGVSVRSRSVPACSMNSAAGRGTGQMRTISSALPLARRPSGDKATA